MLNYYGLPVRKDRVVYSTRWTEECPDLLEMVQAGPQTVVITPEHDERLEALGRRKSLHGILIARQARLVS